MIEPIATLHVRIEQVQRALALARQAGHPYEAHLHRRRLAGLIEAAERDGVNVAPWLDPAIMSAREEL